MPDSLKEIFQVIDTKLEKLGNNDTFSLPSLYGEKEWQRLYIGDRVKAGNAFRREVLKGHYQNVKLLPHKDHKNRSQYAKYT